MAVAAAIPLLILAVALLATFELLWMARASNLEFRDVALAHRRLSLRGRALGDGFPKDPTDYRQLRRDFLTVWSACRAMAAVSEDTDFVFNLCRAYAVFHYRYALVGLDLALGLDALRPHADFLATAADGLAQSAALKFDLDPAS